jgi:hypothetical protein
MYTVVWWFMELDIITDPGMVPIITHDPSLGDMEYTIILTPVGDSHME